MASTCSALAGITLPVIEMLEKDLKTTVLSSIPAQVWATKKILHLNEPLTGYGRLLAEMP